MTLYRVTWEIDIDADSPLGAAQHALAIQRDPENIATLFVVESDEMSKPEYIDPEDQT